MKKESTKINPLRIFVLLFLILVFIFSGIKIWSTLNTPNITEAEPETISKTIIRNDTAYFPRQDITVFMLLGIDEFGPVKASDSYNNKGEADMIALIVFDHTEKNYDIVVVNRDTMMDVPVLGINGHKAGTAYQQVALSHTYGSGLEDSCENTEEAISNFFYGLNIDYYMSINMDAISILTDAVGGVEVDVTDDFSEIDPSITTGKNVLNGDQALTFIRSRRDLGDQLNISRIERHKEFMNGFIEAFMEASSGNEAFALRTFDKIADYTVTNCSTNTMSTLLSQYSDYLLNDVLSPEGENIKGKTFMEFHPDEEKLDKFILDLFYEEKQ